MAKPNNNPFPILYSDRLILRKMELFDEPELYAMLADADNRKYIDQPSFENINDIIEYINVRNEFVEKNDCVYWAITLKEERKMIGTICLWDFSDDYKKAEVGYELNANYQGKGIMDEALQSVINYAFNILKINQLEAFTQSGNVGSIKLLEKNNFQKQRAFKAKYNSKKGYYEMVVFCLNKID
ncbi:MAG: GNAT family N-acetyltransferase [Saprospiraceae bacterium]